MGELIRSEVIPGTAAHFRALMQGLAIRCGGRWVSSTGGLLVFYEERQIQREFVAIGPSSSVRSSWGEYHERLYKDIDVTPPTRTSWEVNLLCGEGRPARYKPLGGGNMPIAWASIEAYELPMQKTRVDFFDGQTPVLPQDAREPIGPAFAEFAELVVREAQEQPSAPTAGETADTGSGAGGEIVLQQGKPGAKRDRTYNTAWTQHYCPQRGGSFQRAYDWYLQETGKETGRSTIRGFRRAMQDRCKWWGKGCMQCHSKKVTVTK